MRRSAAVLLSLVSAFATIFIAPSVGLSWGFFAHREIHRQAIKNLPPEMGDFFAAWSDTLIALSIAPDVRRSKDTLEALKHYIDIDRYGGLPFRELPRAYEDAARKYGRAHVDSNGTVPWTIIATLEGLTDAMRRKDRDAILARAGDLGHYVADAHVPLHATENYDGQMTGQKGLHSRWESRIPERFGQSYRIGGGTAVYIAQPLDNAFSIVLESFSQVDSVLQADRKACAGIPKEELITTREVRGRMVSEYSTAYYDAMHRELNGMVERRMQKASVSVASHWYTAWVNAGRPDFSTLLPQK